MLLSSPALAYIDPGTGGVLLQVLAAGFFTLIIFFRTIREQIAQFFRRLLPRRKTSRRDHSDEN
jgi:hypothetical protein